MSSLLEDARFSHGPLVLPSQRNPSDDPSNVLPDVFENNTPVRELFTHALRELGLDVCASLDHSLFEAMFEMSDVFALLAPREVEALEGASLVTIVDSVPQWSVDRRSGEFKEALADMLSDQVDAQESMTETFAALWALERSIRRAIRSRAQAVWGASWRQTILNGDLPERVLTRASVAAYAAAKSVKEIRDPLEWLTLAELLDIRETRKELGELGLRHALWAIFASEVLPIRNQLSHMRLIRPTALPIVRKWAKVFERKLNSSGD